MRQPRPVHRRAHLLLRRTPSTVARRPRFGRGDSTRRCKRATDRGGGARGHRRGTGAPVRARCARDVHRRADRATGPEHRRRNRPPRPRDRDRRRHVARADRQKRQRGDRSAGRRRGALARDDGRPDRLPGRGARRSEHVAGVAAPIAGVAGASRVRCRGVGRCGARSQRSVQQRDRTRLSRPRRHLESCASNRSTA